VHSTVSMALPNLLRLSCNARLVISP
jgi:hypothetical protein